MYSFNFFPIRALIRVGRRVIYPSITFYNPNNKAEPSYINLLYTPLRINTFSYYFSWTCPPIGLLCFMVLSLALETMVVAKRNESVGKVFE